MADKSCSGGMHNPYVGLWEGRPACPDYSGLPEKIGAPIRPGWDRGGNAAPTGRAAGGGKARQWEGRLAPIRPGWDRGGNAAPMGPAAGGGKARQWEGRLAPIRARPESRRVPKKISGWGRRRSPARILCVILDRAFVELASAPAAAREAAGSGADVIQYRDKTSPAREMLSAVLALKNALQGSRVPLIVNDRLDIALAAGADGVHLGQDDLPAAAARRLGGGEFIVGVSAATADEARAAAAAGADYLGAGAFFPTATKQDIRPIDRTVFAEIVRAVRLPVLAIGGITPDNLSEALSAGASGVAVISAALRDGSVSRAVARLREALDKR